MNHIKLVLALCISLSLSACATLNKSECRNADWKIIGLEDGSKGRNTTYIGNHRKACAEYGVAPDLDRYLAGHREGLEQFCTAEIGFTQGKRGYQYNGVCPAEFRGDFLYGYERGHELYLIAREINQINRRVKNMDSELTDINTRINELELQLISKAGSAEKRLAMLQELKELQTTLGTMENEIHNLELDAARRQGEYDTLNTQYAF
jgi:hypothetical protein